MCCYVNKFQMHKYLAVFWFSLNEKMITSKRILINSFFVSYFLFILDGGFVYIIIIYAGKIGQLNLHQKELKDIILQVQI